jgi:hypothetical protein
MENNMKNLFKVGDIVQSRFRKEWKGIIQEVIKYEDSCYYKIKIVVDSSGNEIRLKSIQSRHHSKLRLYHPTENEIQIFRNQLV